MQGETYCVTSSELLLRADDSASTLGLVQSSLSSDDSLTLSRAAARLASDLGDSIPVV